MKETLDRVENILRKNKKARNSDKFLIFKYLAEHTSLKKFPKSIQALVQQAIEECQPFETITRSRRVIQADGGYPADGSVLKARKAKSKQMKDLMR